MCALSSSAPRTPGRAIWSLPPAAPGAAGTIRKTLAAASFFGGVQCPAQAGEVDHSEQAGVAGGWQVTEMPGRHDRGGVTVVVMAGRVVITA
jgi:hypothetical protein